jgi:hypothetical protein
LTRLVLPGVGEPDWPCHMCGENLPSQREHERHVGPCARAKMDEIHAAVEVRRRSIFDTRSWDPEVAEHMRKVGERMKAEGRSEVRPDERAGFS